MSKVKRRKARPQPPRHYWYDADNCWCCKDRNNCSGCRFLKDYVATHNKPKNKFADVAEWQTR